MQGDFVSEELLSLLLLTTTATSPIWILVLVFACSTCFFHGRDQIRADKSTRVFVIHRYIDGIYDL